MPLPDGIVATQSMQSTGDMQGSTHIRLWSTTPAFVVPLFVLLVSLNPIPDPNVGRASNERWLLMLIEVILTLYGIIPIITEGCEPIKVTAIMQIMCTADHIPPPQTIGFVSFICMIHHANEGVHTSLQPATTWVKGQQLCQTISIAPHPITYRAHCMSGDHFQWASCPTHTNPLNQIPLKGSWYS